MKNMKKRIIELLGQEKGMKVYWFFYNHSFYSSRFVIDIQKLEHKGTPVIRFWFGDGMVWEFAY